MTMDVTSSKASAAKSNSPKKTKAKAWPKAKKTPSSKTKSTMRLVGLDLGTYMSCFITRLPKPAAEAGATLVPTVVGYAEDGILSGILPGNASVLFGDHALAIVSAVSRPSDALPLSASASNSQSFTYVEP